MYKKKMLLDNGGLGRGGEGWGGEVSPFGKFQKSPLLLTVPREKSGLFFNAKFYL